MADGGRGGSRDRGARRSRAASRVGRRRLLALAGVVATLGAGLLAWLVTMAAAEDEWASQLGGRSGFDAAAGAGVDATAREVVTGPRVAPPAAEPLGVTVVVDEPDGAVAVMLRGRVLGATARPLEGARVGLLPEVSVLAARQRAARRADPTDPGPAPDLDARAVTDAHGVFALALPVDRRGAPGGTPALALLVRAEGHAARQLDADWYGAPLTDLGDVLLEAQVRLVGRVVDSLGRPLEDVQVAPDRWLEDQPGRPGWRGAREALVLSELATRSDAHGFFALEGLGRDWSGRLALRRAGCIPGTGGPALSLEDEVWEHDVGDLVYAVDRRVEGVVEDADGEPLRDVLVALSATAWRSSDDGSLLGEVAWRADRWPAWTTLTDGEGRFVLTGVGHPVVRLYAHTPRHAPAVIERVEPGGPSLTVRLEPAEPLGLVVQADDQLSGPAREDPDLPTLADARVEVELRDEALALYRRGPRLWLPTVHHGELPGHVTIHGAAAAHVDVIVRAPGRVPRRARLATLPLDEGRDVRLIALQPESTIRGRVVDQGSGRALAGVPLRVAPARADGVEQVRTDREGRFELGGLGTGAHHLHSATPSWQGGTEPPVVLGFLDQHVDVGILELRAAGRAGIDGVVLDVRGEPQPGRPVDVLCGSSPRCVRRVVSDHAGRFALRRLHAGEVALSTSGALAVVAVPPGEVLPVELVVPAVAVVTGAVTNAGHPVGGASVELHDLDGVAVAPVGGVSTTDADGRYELRVHAEGLHELRARSPWGRRGPRRDAHLVPGQVVEWDLSLDGPALHGVVSDAEDGQPLAGVTVEGRCDRGLSEWSVTTDDRGGFRFASVPTSTFELHVELEGYEPFEQRRRSRWSRDPVVLELVPEPPRVRLSGWAAAADGGPVFDGTSIHAVEGGPGLFIEALDIDAHPRALVEQGRFAFELTPGTWTLVHVGWLRREREGWERRLTALRQVHLHPRHDAEVDVRFPPDDG